MEKTYQPEQIEQQWYQTWENAGYFKPNDSGIPYCIMLPPPNVTGTLHMGHGFQVSLMDALIRYHRMQGRNVLWQVGTDHAGIATQMVVELQLTKEGTNRHELGREKFEERVWAWKDVSDGTIKSQLRRMGASVDWQRERFSMDEGLSEAVQKVFIELYEEGLLYRGKRLVNWDPILLTAISDLEVISHEEEGSLWYIRYPVENSEFYIVVATTRPETMLGDTAVAVHPADPRYQHLIGQHILLPLSDRRIPIIADDSVAQDFGTGCVKITPAHDFNDYAMGERHHLPLINILTPDAKINDQAPNYQGLDRFVAREKIVADLTQLGLIEKIEPHLLKVPKGERSGTVIEPYLTNQWFVKAKPLAEPAIKVVKEGDIQFVPENWTKIYYQWLENIQDWCISRQLWWGHRIPAWYDQAGNVYVGPSEQTIRQQHQLTEATVLTQDEDVLDTWFSSALWPFATLGWPQNTKELVTFYPTNVLITGFDIIFFWVARMVMMGLKFGKAIPFDTVYITGLIRDHEGQKMSKSKGNILDPIDLIDGISLDKLITKRTQNLIHPKDAQRISTVTAKEFPNGIPPFGTDSLRFTYYALAATGRDIRFDLGRIEGYRNFCNKLWNASRYVLMNTEGQPETAIDLQYSLADRWIQSHLQTVIQKIHHYFENYRFDLLAQTLYEFIWNEYCDWYLELSKTTIYHSQNASEQAGTRKTLITVLETLLRLTHPLMPFITEEIWQRVSKLAHITAPSIMLQPYPIYDDTLLDETANQDIEQLKKIVIAIRNIRGEMNIAPNKMVSIVLKGGDQTIQDRVGRLMPYINSLAKVNDISWHQNPPSLAATALIDNLELYIPMADLIDKGSELARLNKEIDKLHIEIQKSSSKLNNPNYLAKAPKDVVTQEQQRATDLQDSIVKLKERMTLIETID